MKAKTVKRSKNSLGISNQMVGLLPVLLFMLLTSFFSYVTSFVLAAIFCVIDPRHKTVAEKLTTSWPRHYPAIDASINTCRTRGDRSDGAGWIRTSSVSKNLELNLPMTPANRFMK